MGFGGLVKAALQGFADGLGGDVGGQRRKQREREVEAAQEELKERVKLYLRHFVEGVEALEKFQSVLMSMGVMYLVQNAPLDTSSLTQRHIDELQQYTETLVEYRKQGRSVLLDGETRDSGRRSRWTGRRR